MSGYVLYVSCRCFRDGLLRSAPPWLGSFDELTLDRYGRLVHRDGTILIDTIPDLSSDEFMALSEAGKDDFMEWLNRMLGWSEDACDHHDMRLFDHEYGRSDISLALAARYGARFPEAYDLAAYIDGHAGIVGTPSEAARVLAELASAPVEDRDKWPLANLIGACEAAVETGNPIVRYFNGSHSADEPDGYGPKDGTPGPRASWVRAEEENAEVLALLSLVAREIPDLTDEVANVRAAWVRWFSAMSATRDPETAGAVANHGGGIRWRYEYRLEQLTEDRLEAARDAHTGQPVHVTNRVLKQVYRATMETVEKAFPDGTACPPTTIVAHDPHPRGFTNGVPVAFAACVRCGTERRIDVAIGRMSKVSERLQLCRSHYGDESESLILTPDWVRVDSWDPIEPD